MSSWNTTLLSMLFIANFSMAHAERPRMKDYLQSPSCERYQWPTKPLAESGLDIHRLNAAIDHIHKNQFEIHSFSIIKGGALVFDYYGVAEKDGKFQQRTPCDVQELHSVTKTITGAVIGIAINKKRIDSVKSPISQYLPDIFKGEAQDKLTITIEDALTLRTGFTYEEGRDDAPIFFDPENSAQALVKRPLATKPGTTWNYSSGDSQLLAEIIKRVSQRTPAQYTQDVLFTPLEIEKPPRWKADKSGTHYGGWGLYLTPRQLLRFGQMHLQEGRWNGKQVLPKSWLAEYTKPRVQSAWVDYLGYHIWLPSFGGYSAAGVKGQIMYMLPELDLIVLYTADLPWDKAGGILSNILLEYVAPSLKAKN